MKTLCAWMLVALLSLSTAATPALFVPATKDSRLLSILTEIDNTVTQIKGEVSDKTSEEYRTLNVASDSVDTLIQFAQTKKASRDYVYSLDLDHSLLHTYRRSKDIGPLKLSSSDLNTKASYAEANPTDPFKPIRVRAHTKNSLGQVQQGYRVWSAMSGELSSGFKTFSCLSSPAVRLLSAGDHFFYATRNPITTQPHKFPIGDNTKPGPDGYREEDIDVDVP